MLSKKTNRSVTRGLAFAALGAVAMAACDADRENFISPIGDVILDFPIGNAPSNLPTGAGAIDAFALAGFDATASGDAFARSTGALGLYYEIDNPFGATEGYDLSLGVRNNTNDPRLPALTASSADVGGFFGMFNPAWTGFGPGIYDLFGELTGLAPNTTYIVALARMSLTVNGTLDTEEMLLTGAVTQPDQLSLLGGTEGGDHTVFCNFVAPVDVDADTNPVALGFVVTDASGAVTVDCLPRATGNSPWWRNNTTTTPPGAADSTAFGVNSAAADGGEVRPGQFNYVLLYEGTGAVGNPVPDVAPTVRIQMGPDIDASGNVIDNAMAPFPAGQASDADLLAAPGGFGQASALSFDVTNLAPLSGVYQVWLANVETGAVVSPTGDITITNEDDMGMEVIVSQSTGNSFNTTDISDEVTFVTSDSINGAPVGNYTHIFVSIEGAAAGAPSAAQPLYGQFTDMAGMPDDASAWTFIDSFPMTFGTFNLGDSPMVYGAGGFGQGAFTGANFGTADLFRARFRNVSRPPVGYYYEGFLRQIEDGDVVSESSTGDLTTEFAEGFLSLRDVDIDPSISSQVGPTFIIESANRATLAEVGSPFETFEDYVLRLRPKSAAGATSGSILAQGDLPEALTARAQE